MRAFVGGWGDRSRGDGALCEMAKGRGVVMTGVSHRNFPVPEWVGGCEWCHSRVGGFGRILFEAKERGWGT
eukprot:758461-Hanusia_phi.AAC.5